MATIRLHIRSLLLIPLVLMSCEKNVDTSKDEVALTLENYRNAWLEDDSEGVMNSLSEDIMLYQNE